MEKLLKEKGFSVLETGNASSYDFKETVIQVKSKVTEKFLTTLESTLKKITCWLKKKL